MSMDGKRCKQEKGKENRYSNYALKIKNSKLIIIIQKRTLEDVTKYTEKCTFWRNLILCDSQKTGRTSEEMGEKELRKNIAASQTESEHTVVF